MVARGEGKKHFIVDGKNFQCERSCVPHAY